LRTINNEDISCNKIILQSPWIPIIEVLIICANNYEVCLPQCKTFEIRAVEEGLDVNFSYIEGLGHNYPENFNEIVLDFVNKNI